ncbi:thiolase family protein [Rhizobiales bacterium 3FA27D7]|uniref:thiolase family protein n=1 Tax=Mesorhizobium sp. 2RAF21 TaxID=3232995 RepID=UPI0010F891F6
MRQTSNTKVAIPYGLWWSTPFARWQGALAHLHSLRFAAHVAQRELAARNLSPEIFDFSVLGTTVPQQGAFYGAPWILGMIGADHVPGPTITQACSTGARVLAVASDEIRRGNASAALVLAADRVSNGPQIYYPDPEGQGGSGQAENWILDNFSKDPYADVAMVETAEAVAAEHGISTAEQNEATLCRYEQYQAALRDDSAFLRRFMCLPFDVPDKRFTKVRTTLSGDVGIYPTTAEGLAALKPVLPKGTVNFGGQTHPADGNAGMVVTNEDKAREISRDPSVKIEIVSFGNARAGKARMPAAPVPAARKALELAGMRPDQIHCIKTHNPFIVNDVLLARDFGIPISTMNNFGSSLVWGHPQAPTALRAVIELIEELALRGGGYGLFTGCAAGDSAMALIVHVDSGTSRA